VSLFRVFTKTDKSIKDMTDEFLNSFGLSKQDLRKIILSHHTRGPVTSLPWFDAVMLCSVATINVGELESRDWVLLLLDANGRLLSESPTGGGSDTESGLRRGFASEDEAQEAAVRLAAYVNLARDNPEKAPGKLCWGELLPLSRDVRH
jgi:hypothetical protein